MTPSNNLQAFFEQFGQQIYNNINPNVMGDELKRKILLNRFNSPQTEFSDFTLKNIDLLAKYFEDKFLQKIAPKTELNNEQRLRNQLKNMGITLSENEFKGLFSGEKVNFILHLKNDYLTDYNPHNKISIRLDSMTLEPKLLVRFQQAKLVIPKEIAKNISKNDRKTIVSLAKLGNSFSYTIPNTNTTLHYKPSQKPLKPLTFNHSQTSIFSEITRTKTKI